MDKKLIFYLSVVLLLGQTYASNEKFCYTRVTKYAAERYCSSYSWWKLWCWSHAYRTACDGYSMKKMCCPGYQGSDCATPICNPPCQQGYRCTSPGTCEPCL